MGLYDFSVSLVNIASKRSVTVHTRQLCSSFSEQLPETPGFRTAVTATALSVDTVCRMQGKCARAVFPVGPGEPLPLFEITAGPLSFLGPLGTETPQE